MPANDFEKQAKQLLDELSFRPKEEVWIEVEKQIREKKRRRWILWLPILAALVAGGYYFVASTKTNSPVEIAAANKAVAEPGKTPQETINAGEQIKKEQPIAALEDDMQPAKQMKAAGKNSSVDQQTTKPVIIADVKASTLKNDSKTNDRSDKRKRLINKSLAANEELLTKRNKTADSKNRGEAIVKEPVISEATVSSVVNNPSMATQEKSNAVTTEAINSAAENKSSEKEINNAGEITKVNDITDSKDKTEEKISTADTTAKKDISAIDKKETNPKKKNKNRWQPGVNISTGISNLSETALGLNQAKNLDYLGGLAASPSPQPVYYPSANYKAVGFQAGLFLQRDLSKRTKISVGINYGFYQSRIKTSTLNDSISLVASNSLQYTSIRRGNVVYGSGNNYSIKLHYLELPVNFSWQINRSKQVPVYWNAGVSVTHLLSSNYLHYDTAAGGFYFKDNKLLNRTGINFQTGISVTLFANKKYPITAGPVVQVSATDLSKLVADKKYLLYGGLRLQMVLPGKKK